MKKYISILLLVLVANQLRSQSTITFNVNISDLILCDFFSSKNGDKIIIRGSFNQWSSDIYELKPSTKTGIYTGNFSIGKIGDTISYKYVILKNDNQLYWENNPNPKNFDYGNRQYVIRKRENLIPTENFSYDEYISYPVLFNQKKYQEDYLQFREILETSHPALYDYTSKKDLDSIFDANYTKIKSETDYKTFYTLLSEVIAKVGCGHSSLWIPNKYWHIAPKKLFPLQLAKSYNKTIVIGNHNESTDIALASEIIAINGLPIEIILDKLESLTSADGFNTSYRETKVVLNFAEKYAIYFDFPESFIVDYKLPGKRKIKSINIAPVSKEIIDKNKIKPNELSFKMIDKNKSGILIINSFGYYTQVEMFHNFIDSVFDVINKHQILNLILDLRGNEGGDPFCSSYLWSYLQQQSVPYFIDHYGRYDTLALPIPIPENHFKGRLYTLIDGNCFSTTGHLCGLLKYHNIGKFIGSETGATYTCTGNAIYPPLKNTEIMAGTAIVTRYTVAVQNMDARRGIIPDYEIQNTQKDIIKGKDAVMEFTLSLTRKK